MQTSDEMYKKHSIHSDLKYYAKFYEMLSDSVMSYVNVGTSTIMNMDTYVFMSIKCTIESIALVLQDGKVNDAYALLRKYNDAVIINAYTNLYLQDNAGRDGYYIEEINSWLKGCKPLPRIQKMDKYLVDSNRISDLSRLLSIDSRYELIRDRCNDNVHYNSFSLLVMNEGQVYMQERIKVLSQLQQDIKEIFALNISYMFIISPHYMCSSDYIDFLECGMEPPHGSQDWVADFIQEAIDIVLKPTRYDVYSLLKEKTSMHIS